MEKNNSRVCRICDKRFSSGKAMGGHMRSHFAKLPIPPKPETKNQSPDNSAELTQYPIQSASSLTYHSKKKPTQNFRSLKRNFFAFLANSNRGNESGSDPKNPTRKRSKCHSKLSAEADTKAEPKQMNSIPETFHAEEAAWSLLMLSKDKWPESKEIKTHKMKEAIEREAKDGENGSDDLLHIHTGARFKCERCGKVFQSYQALGGHKANHKRKNLSQEGGDLEDDQSGNNSNVTDQKAFECPYCYRVFKSAQALGGHKKVHFSNAKIATAHTSTNEFGDMSAVDLNFPASREHEEDATWN
ncbi:Zinc finger C2H2-type [Sesbania bispinosa]|nr:Zinc finger C2H2-type [Sesbania bispinosa]